MLKLCLEGGNYSNEWVINLIRSMKHQAPSYNRIECKSPKSEHKFELKPQPQIVLNSNPYAGPANCDTSAYAGIYLEESEFS